MQLSAPQIQAAAKQAGLSSGQISGLMQAFQGCSRATGLRLVAVMQAQAVTRLVSETAPGPGYQGGISDIGYPPFIAPSAEYHADKGSSWVGPYDPNFLVQRYAGGTVAGAGVSGRRRQTTMIPAWQHYAVGFF